MGKNSNTGDSHNVKQPVASGQFHAGTMRARAAEWGISRRAAAKIESGKQRDNPNSPFFGMTKEAHIEALGGSVSKKKEEKTEA